MKSTVFMTNRTQAVRIPKELAFPQTVKEVEVHRDGEKLTIVPRRRDWADWFENGPRFSEDFPTDIEDLPPEPVPSFDD
jgi:antitoxin VapB